LYGIERKATDEQLPESDVLALRQQEAMRSLNHWKMDETGIPGSASKSAIGKPWPTASKDAATHDLYHRWQTEYRQQPS